MTTRFNQAHRAFRPTKVTATELPLDILAYVRLGRAQAWHLGICSEDLTVIVKRTGTYRMRDTFGLGQFGTTGVEH